MKKISSLFILLASSVVLTNTASASLYTQNFESFGLGSTISGWSKIGGFNGDVITDGNPGANGSKVAFFDTMGSDFPTTTAIIADLGIAYDSSLTYTVSFDLLRESTGPDYRGTISGGLYAGNPSSGVLLGSFSDATNGNALGLTFSTSQPVASGNLFLRFFAGMPTNTNGYAQAELDNISIEAVPEPLSMGILAIGVAAFARRKRK